MTRVIERNTRSRIEIDRRGRAGELRLQLRDAQARALWTAAGPHFVDLDDAVNGPAVQDLWMLLGGDRHEMQAQLGALLDGYEMIRDFDRRELALIEPLRTLRIIQHSAWIARRWDDPAFPIAFPNFESPSYWDQQTTQLHEQIAAMADEPLVGGLAPMLGGSHLRVLTVRGFPTSTWPGLLEELNRLAFAYRWSTRAIMLDKTDATKLLTKIRRQWFAKRKSFAAILKEVMTNEASVLMDSDASNKAADADMGNPLAPKRLKSRNLTGLILSMKG